MKACDDTLCQINPVSSRMCELGTKSCTATHSNWSNYIAKLPDSIPEQHQAHIRAMWNSIKSFAPNPTQAELVNNIDPACFSFIWDKGHHHLDIDLWEDGYAEWFYRNRRNDEVDGTDIEPFHCAFITDSDCPEGLKRAFKLIGGKFPDEQVKENWWQKMMGWFKR